MKIKKSKYIGLLFVIIVIIFLTSVFSARNFPTDFIEISNCYELQEINNNPSNNYILVNDIDCRESRSWNNGRGFIPLGRPTFEDNSFKGYFEGNGFIIKNLYINRPKENYIGLFGVIGRYGIVSNLGLENIKIKGNNNVGGIVGHNAGEISNSYTKGKIKGVNTVGGIVGNNANIIRNIYSSARILGRDRIGGIIGFNWARIRNSYFSGEIICLGRKLENSHYGGLIGFGVNMEVINSYYDSDNLKCKYCDNEIGSISHSNLTSVDFLMNNGWDFNHIWSKSNDGRDYIKLLYQEEK